MVTDINAIPIEKESVGLFEFLPFLALCIDLFTPYLIWKGILPSAIRWGSHAAVATMIVVSLLRMLRFDHIPRSFCFIVVVAVIWSFVAMGNGQGLPSTVWGVWLLFQFPFVGLFAYTQPVWPLKFPEYLRKFGLSILVIEVTAQLLQLAAGVNPGDDLSGLFGENGTGNALLFIILICCLFFGHWIASKQSQGLVTVLILGSISSVLGEMKLFLAVVPAIGVFAIALYAIKHRSLVKMLLYLILLLTVLIAFVYLYNLIVPGANQVPIQSFITDPANLFRYLNRVESYNRNGFIYSDIGRGYAVKLGWESLQIDPITFLFGYGIGSRSESKTLGTAGVALSSGGLGLSVGTSLLVVMQEMGLIGLVVFCSFILWVILSLVRDIREKPGSLSTEIRYAILLFSALWPVWLWYAVTWTMRVPMLLYWLSLGYVFAESHILSSVLHKKSTGLLA